MSNSISQFISILAENNFLIKQKEIPDYIDNYDEKLAELHSILEDDGTLPVEYQIYEVNGFDNASELNELLKGYFNQFKVEFLTGNYGKNIILVKEIENQVEQIKKSIEQAVYESNQNKVESLIELIGIKSHYFDELTAFIKNQKSAIIALNQSELVETSKLVDSKESKRDKIRVSYKWLKKREELEELFHKMIANELIAEDTQIDDFKAVFSSIPVDQIKNRIQWVKEVKLLVYFFSELMRLEYIPKKPSWILLEHFFTQIGSMEGTYIPFKVANRTLITSMHNPSPKEMELVDELFQITVKK